MEGIGCCAKSLYIAFFTALLNAFGGMFPDVLLQIFGLEKYTSSKVDYMCDTEMCRKSRHVSVSFLVFWQSAGADCLFIGKK